MNKLHPLIGLAVSSVVGSMVADTLAKMPAPKPLPIAEIQKAVNDPTTPMMTVVDSVPTPTQSVTAAVSNTMTKDELLAEAAKRGVKVAKSWTKAKIIDTLAYGVTLPKVS